MNYWRIAVSKATSWRQSFRSAGKALSDAPVLTSKRVSLYEALPDDLPELAIHWNEPEVRRFLFDGEPVTIGRASSLFDAFTSLGASGTGFWICRLNDGGDFVGSAGLFVSTVGAELEPRLTGLVEPVLSVTTSLHGQGLGTETLSILIRHAFRHHGLPRLAATVDEPNVRSVALVERAGFKRLSKVSGPAHPLLTFILEADDWQFRHEF